MALFDPKKDTKRTYANIAGLFFIVLLLLFIIVVLINIMIGTITWESFSIDFINSLIGVMIPLLLFNFFFDRLTKIQNNHELSENIVQSVLLEKKVLNAFSVDQKKTFIKSITESIVGENEGKMLYTTTLMSPYLDNKYNFRRNFRYNISYTDQNDVRLAFDQGEINFDKDTYYIVHEELNFIRSMNHYNLKEKKVSAGFSYGMQELEPLFKGEGVFFRENFLVLDDHIRFLQNLNDQDMDRFVREVLQFKFELDDHDLEYVVTNSRDGFYLKFDIDERIEIKPGKEYKFKYTFQMPQLKTENKFIAIVSEPTENVDIFFNHTANDVKITAIPFFDESEAINYLPNNIIKVELNKWVLPRAGVVFTWDYIKDKE